MSHNVINTAHCDECEYGVVEGDNKTVMTYCRYKEKTYHYGQIIPCEFKTKKKESSDECSKI